MGQFAIGGPISLSLSSSLRLSISGITLTHPPPHLPVTRHYTRTRAQNDGAGVNGMLGAYSRIPEAGTGHRLTWPSSRPSGGQQRLSGAGLPCHAVPLAFSSLGP